ncbi:MAG TPA: hypothetical protein VEZ70_03925 [Allosphingosinicella sp.]|nr:hypothetical protein [Allosphingosinicella sp.]
MTVRPVGTGWLCAHEFRLHIRSLQFTQNAKLYGVLLLGFLLAGVGFVLFVRKVPVPAQELTGLAAALSLFLTLLIFSNTLVAGPKIFSKNADLAMLATAPVPFARVMQAKLAGIAAGLTFAYCVPLLLLLLPFALAVQPRILGAVVTLPLLSFGAAASAFLFLVLLIKLFGAAKARTYANICAALAGGIFFCLYLLLYHQQDFNAVRMTLADVPAVLIAVVQAPARGILGDPLAMVAVGATAIALSWLATYSLTRELAFGTLHQKLRTAGPAMQKPMSALPLHSPAASILAKDTLVLARDPELLFKLGLRVMYAVPLVAVILRGGASDPFVLVAGISFVLGQLASSLAWLLISGDDHPSLLKTAPVAPRLITRTKIALSATPSILFAVVASIALARWSVVAALCMFWTTVLVAFSAAWLQALTSAPSSKQAFLTNKDLTVTSMLITLSVSAALAGLGAWIGYRLQALIG